jgi:hypothetical protein
MRSVAITITHARARRNARLATLALLPWLLAVALGPARAQAKVYFSAFLATGGTGIERAGFDGNALETLQFEPTGFEDDLAVDAVHGRLYWTDTNASVISSANMNGTDAQIVLDDFGSEPLGIALDVAHGKMYFTDREGVNRANLNGSEAELLSKEPARGFIAVDPAAQQMYWTDWPSGDIKAAAMAREPVVTNLVTKQAAPFGIAVDHAGGKVYWLQLNLNKKKNEKEEIRRANLDGTEVQTLLERPGAGFEGGLAINPAAGKLYWTEAVAHDIGVSNLNGETAQTLFSTGEDIPEGVAVETSNPHPTNTSPPVIEGGAQVGIPLSCNAGTWTGIGAISLSYQWGIVGATAIEGAIASTFVPSVEETGSLLVCVVTAADAVETSTATSAAVSVGAFPSAPVTLGRTPLVAGIALAQLRSRGTKASVPVFTSMAGTATLRAIPLTRRAIPRRPRAAPHRARRALRRARSTRVAKPRRRTTRPRRPAKRRIITVSRRLSAGRGTIILNGLVPGTTYWLVLTISSGDGQTVKDTATLRVTRR